MKISIITITFNSGDTLQETIDSVRKQTYDNIEYIIVDGDSKDNTLDIIKKNDDFISQWVSEPDNGIYDAMNKGLSMATGDIVGILNSDDFYPTQEVIQEVVKKFKESGSEAIYGNIKIVHPIKTNRILRVWNGSPYKVNSFQNGWHPPHPTFFVKRSNYQKFGHFNIDLNVSADFELMLRFIQKHQIKTSYLDKTLVHMRHGGESTASIKNVIEGNKNIKLAFQINGYTYPKFYFYKRMLNKILQLKFKK